MILARGGYKPLLLLFMFATFLGCEESKPTLTSPEPVGGIKAASTAGDTILPEVLGRVVTTDPKLFAKALQKVGNDGEILVRLKSASTPPLDPGFLIDRFHDADVVIGLPQRAKGVEKRNQYAPATPLNAGKSQVTDALSSLGLEPYFVGRSLPVMAVRLPQSAADVAIQLLLSIQMWIILKPI